MQSERRRTLRSGTLACMARQRPFASTDECLTRRSRNKHEQRRAMGAGEVPLAEHSCPHCKETRTSVMPSVAAEWARGVGCNLFGAAGS
jgi:hypothetical protein